MHYAIKTCPSNKEDQFIDDYFKNNVNNNQKFLKNAIMFYIKYGHLQEQIDEYINNGEENKIYELDAKLDKVLKILECGNIPANRSLHNNTDDSEQENIKLKNSLGKSFLSQFNVD